MVILNVLLSIWLLGILSLSLQAIFCRVGSWGIILTRRLYSLVTRRTWRLGLVGRLGILLIASSMILFFLGLR